MVWESRQTWEYSIITVCASHHIPDVVAVARDEFWVWVWLEGAWALGDQTSAHLHI